MTDGSRHPIESPSGSVPSANMEDATAFLLRRAEAGSAEAINALLNRHRSVLRQVVAQRLDRMVARRVDASDIVQDVLLEANLRLKDYLANPRMPFQFWLKQLAMDRVIEMHRQHRQAQRRSLDREQSLDGPGASGDRSSADAMQQIADPELTPAAANIRRELEQRFLEALDRLEDDDRDIILLRHIEHLGNNEAAAALGLSPAAAGMRHLRALRKLRLILGSPE
jgi:RNA polymerase sigma-70 factor, ECF subfamily